mmetsp:Transcript_795/g.1801  ORF Transcript_795/g.1801 Transcript_795/m.1801 type:complete len:119 (-) Transcript_795:247-603(-)
MTEAATVPTVDFEGSRDAEVEVMGLKVLPRKLWWRLLDLTEPAVGILPVVLPRSILTWCKSSFRSALISLSNLIISTWPSASSKLTATRLVRVGKCSSRATLRLLILLWGTGVPSELL